MAVSVSPTRQAGGIDPSALETFLASVSGDVLTPDGAGYDDARAIQNGLIDRRPALIVKCTGTADVIAAVTFAREQDLLLSVRGGGHNVAGNAVNDGGLVIDLSEMRAVHVDPSSQTARVQGGATWADVDRETQVFGLVAPGGLVSTTGVAGLTLHGGMGHLRRKLGLSIDSLLSVDIVTADGGALTASATENADLFWAVRGAGSNFGVITSFEFQLHPLGPLVMLGATGYALADAPEVIRRWRAFMDTAPEELTSMAIFWSVPPAPHFPAELHGLPVAIIVTMYAGDAEAGERAIQPLRELATPLLDLSGVGPYAAWQAGFDGFFPKGLCYYWKSLYVDGLPDELIDELCELAASRPSPMSPIEIWNHGGAMATVDPSATAFGSRAAPFMLSFDSTWADPAETERNIAWTRAAWSSMHRYSSGGLYLNFPGFGEEKQDLLRAAYGDANYERLVDLKTQYDPTNLFRMNQNIPPRV